MVNYERLSDNIRNKVIVFPVKTEILHSIQPPRQAFLVRMTFFLYQLAEDRDLLFPSFSFP